MNNPSIINQYSLIVLDCPGWYGGPASYAPDRRDKIQTVYNTISSRVQAGNEVIFTDIALLDMNSTFPGYVNLATGGSGTWDSTAYNPPKGGFAPEFPSQYYNSGTNPNNIRLFTEGGGWVVSSVQPAHQSDVRIIIDSNSFGVPYRYAILGFYFQYGNGIVEGLAFHPYEQLYPTYSDENGYYATYEIYGNKFVHGPQLDFLLNATPNMRTIAQGQATTYSVTVTSIGSFSAPVSLQVTGGPPASSVGLSPTIVTPAQGATVGSTLMVQTTLSTPIGSYNLTVTGSSTLPTITRSINLVLNVVPAPSDFTINANPKSPTPLIVNTGKCGNISITIQSIGNFSSPVNQTLSPLPACVTPKFMPNPITPPSGGTVGSILQLCVASNRGARKLHDDCEWNCEYAKWFAHAHGEHSPKSSHHRAIITARKPIDLPHHFASASSGAWYRFASFLYVTKRRSGWANEAPPCSTCYHFQPSGAEAVVV